MTISNLPAALADVNDILLWDPDGGDCNWNEPYRWEDASQPSRPQRVPSSDDYVFVDMEVPGPCIDGGATCAELYIMCRSFPETPDVSVDMYSGILDSGIGTQICAGEPTSNIGRLNVYGGTVTQSVTPGVGIIIGGGVDGYSTNYGQLSMRGGLVSFPKVGLYYGDIFLYGGTLECTTDTNFVLIRGRPQNKIDVSGGVLKLKGNYLISSPIVPELITVGSIYSSRGNIGVAVFDGNNTILTSSDVNMFRPWGPSPNNNATNIHYKHSDGNYITLSWNSGDEPNVINHQVYFGTDYNSVRDATKTSSQFQHEVNSVNAEPNRFTLSNFNFTLYTKYYWRVDDNAVDGNRATKIYKGKVWNFQTHDGKAYNPKPYNGQIGLNEPLALSWTAGDFAATTNGHFIYVGTDSSTVTQATSSTAKVFRARQTDTSYSLGKLATGWYSTGLVPGTTYYWKVSEINGTNQWGNAIDTSVVWTFTPVTVITIEDFEDYNNTADMDAFWLDLTSNGGTGYTMTCTIPPDLGGGTTSITPSGTLSYVLDADGKHANFYYDNTASSKQFSQVKRYYGSSGVIFGTSGILSSQPEALRVDYIGAVTNHVDEIYDRMYVALEDSAGNVGVYDNPDGNAARAANWTQWYSSLYDINVAGTPNPVKLTAVSAFYLGFGERCLLNGSQSSGGNGNVMFDNIRLYAPTTCGGNSSADFDRNNVVDLLDFEWIAEFWLVDYSSEYEPITVPIVDLYPDCIIDYRDFAVFAQQWLMDVE